MGVVIGVELTTSAMNNRVQPVVVEKPRKEKATVLFNFIPQVRAVALCG